MTRAIVIGSGMAGLTAAAFLSRDGCRVDLFEQAGHLGGVTSTLKKDGFSWDLGPMALEGMAGGEPAGMLLKELGCHDRINLIRGDRGLSFPDFKLFRPEVYEGPDWKTRRLKKLFPHEADNLDRFDRFLSTMIDLITLQGHLNIAGPLRSIPIKLGMAVLFMRVKKYAAWHSGQLIDEFFTDPKLKAVFMAILADMTILPEEFPGLALAFNNQVNAYDRRIPPKRALGIGPASSEYNFIQNGCGSLVEALSGVIKQNNGRLHTRSPVRRILIDADRVRGVELACGEKKEADLVLVSGDARECFFKMIGREAVPSDYAKKIDDVPLMESVFMVHLGVAMDPTPFQGVPLNYYYNIYNIEEGVERARAGEYHEGRQGFIIYIPSLHSPGMAPEGKHAVTVYTIAPNEPVNGSWAEDKAEWADMLLECAEKYVPGLRKHTRTRMAITPKDFGMLTQMPDHHSFGGYCPMMDRSGAPQETPFKGLWFIGSQSETGPGVWMQIVSSRNVCKKISKAI